MVLTKSSVSPEPPPPPPERDPNRADTQRSAERAVTPPREER